METRVERVAIPGIGGPLLLVYEPAPLPQPAVVVLHETRRTKESAVEAHDPHLRGVGLLRVYPDLPLHGERPRLSADPSEERARWEAYLRGEGDALHDLIIPLVWGMAQEMSRVLDYLETRSDLAAPRFGVWGFSVAGLIALTAASLEPRLAAVVAAGAPVRFRFMALGMRYAWDNTTIEEARAYDPLQRAAHFFPKALLLIHGVCDEIVPVEAAHSFYTRLKPYYAAEPKRLRLSEYPHFRHSLDKPAPYTTPEAEREIAALRREAREWLVKYLSAQRENQGARFSTSCV